MIEDKLKKMIKAMYLLREILNRKQENDGAFKFKSKYLILSEIEEIIDISLEEFYLRRIN